MNKEKSVNQRCLENILCHLTKMVVLTEHDEIDDLKQLVKMSTSVSSQLLGVTQKENGECVDEDACEVNMTSEHINDYIKARQGKLSKDEISLLIKISSLTMIMIYGKCGILLVNVLNFVRRNKILYERYKNYF